SNHFDTTTGSQKDHETYLIITQFLGLAADQILFLSAIVAELEAAQKAGLQTIQLVRDGAAVGWSHTVQHFLES
ncbi:MAG: acireductone synthase, partial [Flavobacteriia bacterium]